MVLSYYNYANRLALHLRSFTRTPWAAATNELDWFCSTFYVKGCRSCLCVLGLNAEAQQWAQLEVSFAAKQLLSLLLWFSYGYN